MNHPKREEWAPFVYGEVQGETARRLKEHLRGCPACREEIEAWKRTTNRLNAWRLPRLASASEGWRPLLRWAVAGSLAGLVFLAGAGIGRLNQAADSQPSRDAIIQQVRQELREEMATMVREELARDAASTLAACGEQTRQFLATYAKELEAKRTEQDAAYYASLESMYVALKKELDTVAVLTDASLRDTQRRLVHLVDYQQPSGASGNEN